jgi:hypothetical protein
MNIIYVSIIGGITMGTVARLWLLKVDYRQYPSYPQGYITHLTLGFIAAALGAVAVPAVISREYTAVTFLAVAAQQFRDIRNMERQSLQNIEGTELVIRGSAYIEDIARIFEARNYIAIVTSLAASFSIYVTRTWFFGLITGLVLILFFAWFTRRKKIKDIADVRPAEVRFEGPLLMVENIVIMNIGLENVREIYLKHAMGVIIEPKDNNARATLANIGQRQAIAHDAAALLGIKKDVGEPEFTPLIRIDPNNGSIGMAIVTAEPDYRCLIEAVKRVPVLESSRRKPLSSKIGYRAAD